MFFPSLLISFFEKRGALPDDSGHPTVLRVDLPRGASGRSGPYQKLRSEKIRAFPRFEGPPIKRVRPFII
jgi:hypothetical protein